MKSINWPKHSILALAIIATWIKTVIVYNTSFDLELENAMQVFILIINPLSFLLFVYGLSLFFKSTKVRNRYIILVSFVLSFVLYGNVAFYRFYNDFITLPVLFQTSNFGDLGTSASEIVNLWDILYFIDLFILIIALKVIPTLKQNVEVNKNARKAYFVLSIAILFLNFPLSRKSFPILITKLFLSIPYFGAYSHI